MAHLVKLFRRRSQVLSGYSHWFGSRNISSQDGNVDKNSPKKISLNGPGFEFFLANSATSKDLTNNPKRHLKKVTLPEDHAYLTHEDLSGLHYNEDIKI